MTPVLWHNERIFETRTNLPDSGRTVGYLEVGAAGPGTAQEDSHIVDLQGCGACAMQDRGCETGFLETGLPGPPSAVQWKETPTFGNLSLEMTI